MKRRAFIRRMAFAALACGFLDWELPDVVSPNVLKAHDVEFTIDGIVAAMADLSDGLYMPEEWIMHPDVWEQLQSEGVEWSAVADYGAEA